MNGVEVKRDKNGNIRIEASDYRWIMLLEEEAAEVARKLAKLVIGVDDE